jgi:PAS domain S-box-containing protein
VEGNCARRFIESYLEGPLRILHLEDDPRDTELVQATLAGGGVTCELTRVDTQAEFSTHLERVGFDLILADYTLPSFDGISALKLAIEMSPETPFIFVSGTLGEEVAIEALKLGATDYVFKTRLSRIVPAVHRALRERKEHTQRKLAEQTLRQSEAYLAEAQRLSQTGSWAWNPTTGDIRYWSEECYIVLGFDPLGPLPRFETFLRRVHPDDQVATRERFEAAVRDKTDFELDYRVTHPGGEIRDIHAVGHAILGRSRELVEFVGTVIDVTERKRAEEELQQLVDFVPQIIVVLGPDGKWIHANRVAREYTGLTLDQYRSVDVLETVVHPDDAGRMRAVRERGLSAHDPFEIEARLRRKDGVYRWFLFRYNPLIKQGSVSRWYGTATEIESRKNEEDRVRKENLVLGERTRIAQELHDTLLQSFLSASMQLSVALDGIPQDWHVKPLLDRILEIMNQGIAEGRNAIEGLRSTDYRTLDLVLALSRVQQELPVQPHVDFRVIVAGKQKPLQAPIRHDIYRIGREALVNAFCHSGAQSVEFELEYASSDLRMRVRDNGCGIEPQVLRAGRDGHWGLAGMRERAARIGGRLTISSSAASGTEVQLFIPGEVAFQP